jgi:hypothetical protein
VFATKDPSRLKSIMRGSVERKTTTEVDAIIESGSRLVSSAVERVAVRVTTPSTSLARNIPKFARV